LFEDTEAHKIIDFIKETYFYKKNTAPLDVVAAVQL